MQRLCKKISGKELPRTAYSYHYAFLKKRGIREEQYTPSVGNMANEEVKEKIVLEAPKISMWRLSRKVKPHYLDHNGEYWRKPLLFCFVAIMVQVKAYEHRQFEINAALQNTTQGIDELQIALSLGDHST